MESQLTLNFEAGLSSHFDTCREFVQTRVYRSSRPHKAIAADMDYSPSTLSRKLAQSENDSQKLTVDDLEAYMQVEGDLMPIYYLIDKYLVNERSIEELEDELARRKQALTVKKIHSRA
jgi:hypothetical protein